MLGSGLTLKVNIVIDINRLKKKEGKTFSKFNETNARGDILKKYLFVKMEL